MFTQLLHGLQSVENKFTGKMLITSDNDFIIADDGSYVIIADPSGVRIGGKAYPTLKIGNRLWMTEYLDYSWTGLTIGDSSELLIPSASYYDNNEVTYGYNGQKFGLLYNWYAVDYLQTNKNTLLPEGWKVPTKSDYEDLFSRYTLNQLRDVNELNFQMTGELVPTSEFQIYQFQMSNLSVWSCTSDLDDSVGYVSYTDGVRNYVSMVPEGRARKHPIRLIKDLT